MKVRLLQAMAIVSVALYLVPTGAHFFELPHKMALSPAEYMTVQRIYAGWQLFGIVIAVALLATLAHTLVVRADRKACAWSLGAFLGLAMTQGLFWAFTYPVNLATRFWTVTPESFEAARRRWEYSHAASAVLTFAALVAIVASALVHQPRADER
jgi:MFS family permease